MNESKDFHPLVAQWLTKNGYDYEHEFSMPDYGRVDFMASKNSQKYLVEAKIDVAGARKGVMQLVTYRAQVKVQNCILVVPWFAVYEGLYEFASKYNIAVETLNVDDISREQRPPTEFDNSMVATREEWLDMFSWIYEHPNRDLADMVGNSLFMILLNSANPMYRQEAFEALLFTISQGNKHLFKR